MSPPTEVAAALEQQNRPFGTSADQVFDSVQQFHAPSRFRPSFIRPLLPTLQIAGISLTLSP